MAQDKIYRVLNVTTGEEWARDYGRPQNAKSSIAQARRKEVYWVKHRPNEPRLFPNTMSEFEIIEYTVIKNGVVDRIEAQVG